MSTNHVQFKRSTNLLSILKWWLIDLLASSFWAWLTSVSYQSTSLDKLSWLLNFRPLVHFALSRSLHSTLFISRTIIRFNPDLMELFFVILEWVSTLCVSFPTHYIEKEGKREIFCWITFNSLLLDSSIR